MEWSGDVQKKAVVAGGGIAGALLAKIIQDKADVHLIGPCEITPPQKEYFEIPWANLRSTAEKSVINHTDYLTKGNIKKEVELGFYTAQNHAVLAGKNLKLLLKGSQRE